jgi:hypothetical protein
MNSCNRPDLTRCQVRSDFCCIVIHKKEATLALTLVYRYKAAQYLALVVSQTAIEEKKPFGAQR